MDFNGAMENCETKFGSAGGRLFEPRYYRLGENLFYTDINAIHKAVYF